jgi:hypothetical protein
MGIRSRKESWSNVVIELSRVRVHLAEHRVVATPNGKQCQELRKTAIDLRTTTLSCQLADQLDIAEIETLDVFAVAVRAFAVLTAIACLVSSGPFPPLLRLGCPSSDLEPQTSTVASQLGAWHQ